MKTIIGSKESGVSLYLFVRKKGRSTLAKKKSSLANEFYYLGRVSPDPSVPAELITMHDMEKHQDLSAVRIKFLLEHQVRNDIYDYLTNR